MAGYWLKLYTEILDDPKYFRLSDSARLGMYELMIVAKRVDLDGGIPCIEDVAFYTRRSVEWWEPVFNELSKINYIVSNDGNTIIRKFSERQAKVDDAERMKQSRALKHKNQFVSRECYEPVTNRNGETEIDTETDTEKSVGVHPIQRMIETVVKLPPSGPADIMAMDEIEAMNPIQEDIQEAYNFLIGQGKRVTRYTSLPGCVRTAIAKRLQTKPKKLIGKTAEGVEIYE
jgi:hypothetical protein